MTTFKEMKRQKNPHQMSTSEGSRHLSLDESINNNGSVVMSAAAVWGIHVSPWMSSGAVAVVLALDLHPCSDLQIVRFI